MAGRHAFLEQWPEGELVLRPSLPAGWLAMIAVPVVIVITILGFGSSADIIVHLITLVFVVAFVYHLPGDVFGRTRLAVDGVWGLRTRVGLLRIPLFPPDVHVPWDAVKRFDVVERRSGETRVSYLVVVLTDGSHMRTACRGSAAYASNRCDDAQAFRDAATNDRRVD